VLVYTFHFDKAVTGFTASDVVVTNGTLSAFTAIDTQNWTAVVTTPLTGSGTMSVSVANGSFSATTGGASGIGDTITHAYDTASSPLIIDIYGGGISSLSGSAGNDKIVAAGGSTGVAGAETINLGSGDDVLTVLASNVTKLGVSTGNASFDGGAGVDLLKLSGTGLTLDLTNANVKAHLTNFESFDLTGTGNNTLKLSLTEVLDMSNIADNVATLGVDEGRMLVISGNTGDIAQLLGGAAWTSVATAQTAAALNGTYGASYGFLTGHTYAQLSNSGAMLFLDEQLTRTNL
jgi:Bacterial Ig-like domain